MRKILVAIIGGLMMVGCKNDNTPLPYLGQKVLVDGVEKNHVVSPFNLLAHTGDSISSQDLRDVVYIADFFFTSCPSICPKVTKEMLNIYKEFENNDNVKLISFTLDPKRDTKEKLNLYANNLDVSANRWLFLTGEKDSIWSLTNDYFVTAVDDEEAPGGLSHSGTIVLVDKEGHVRSFSDGTDPDSTPRLINDVKKLLKEYE